MKNCSICDRRPSPDSQLPEHHCYRNWTQSSQSMEADILVEGFRRSMQDHQLVYRYVVADADTSVYSQLQSKIIYPGRMPIEKIDCKNHAVRGLNSKLYTQVNTTSNAKSDRDLVKKNLDRFEIQL